MWDVGELQPKVYYHSSWDVGGIFTVSLLGDLIELIGETPNPRHKMGWNMLTWHYLIVPSAINKSHNDLGIALVFQLLNVTYFFNIPLPADQLMWWWYVNLGPSLKKINWFICLNYGQQIFFKGVIIENSKS